MGILGYPNMDDNNHDGIFGDYSDVYSNYPEDNSGVQNVGEEKTLNESVQAGQAQQENLSSVPPIAPQAERQANGRLMFYIVVLCLLLAGAAGMYLYKQKTDVSSTQEQSMGDYFYDQAVSNGAGQDVATVEVDLAQNDTATKSTAEPEVVTPVENAKKESAKKEQAQKSEDKKSELNALDKAEAKKKMDEEKEKQLGFSSVTIPVVSGGRTDPFLPTNIAKSAVETSRFELIAPPTLIPDVDPQVEALMSVKISGIMFDSARPSAIINIGGTDQLVHEGDLVRGYKINDITKQSVVIQYKSNIYQATVGQSLNDGLNINPVSNLSNSFGGTYSKPSANLIEIGN